MRIMVGQINTTPRDFEGNCQKIVKGINLCNLASRNKPQDAVDLLVFPELCIPGYLSQDLVYDKDFINDNLYNLHNLADLTGGSKTIVLVGYIDYNRKGYGKKFRNMVAAMQDGVIIATYQKQLLPFYDVFDEGRYYEPGTDLAVLEIEGEKYGIAICEDVWNDKDQDDYNYQNNPIEKYRQVGVRNIICLNSSPFVKNKPRNRIKMLRKISERNTPDMGKGGTLIYVNQIGGQDELVFDGYSCVLTQGSVRHICGNMFEDSYDIVDLNKGVFESVDISNEVVLKNSIVIGLRDYVRKSGFKQVVFGSSGGVDSAMVACLAVEAVGAENVIAIKMPSVFSSPGSLTDAEKLHQNLGICEYTIPVDHIPFLDKMNKAFVADAASKYNKVADENLQARIRDVYLMHYSNAFGALPLATGNKTESACGYYTHFDMNMGFAPLKDLYKTEIYSLAKRFYTSPEDGSGLLYYFNGIPNEILTKAPSAELAEGQTDESSLLPYEILDPIVEAYIEDYVSNYKAFGDWLTKNYSSLISYILQPPRDKHVSEDAYNRIIRLIDCNEFKRRQTCPGVKVSKVAFGIGRRIPIIKGKI